MCADNSGCYEGWKHCDKVVDCFDNSDEPESCSVNPCDAGKLYCVESHKCVSAGQICDGTNHCQDPTSSNQAARDDATDEQDCHLHACASGYKKCSNNKCVAETKFCDGRNDCGDNSDEITENCRKKSSFIFALFLSLANCVLLLKFLCTLSQFKT